MSRGFVKEGDQEEVPIVPPRAYLPEGVVNYVTTGGMNALLEEKEQLNAQRNRSKDRVERNFISAKLRLLEERIGCAKEIKDEAIPLDRIAFGSRISLRLGSNPAPVSLQITGVDEADITKGKITFVSPLSKGLLGHQAGDSFDIDLPSGRQHVEILALSR